MLTDTALVVVPTPIGNLDDMSFRAVEVLKSVDFILTEDSRTTGKLLKHFGIEKPMHAHHKFNEHKQVDTVLSRLKAGEKAALVSDAGTPGISDPGFLMVRACVENNLEVECLPGATSVIPALVVSGLPCDKFVFEGFLPHKKGRKTRLEFLSEDPRTIVFLESPHRINKTLAQIAEFIDAERRVVICRELSKMYEEKIRGTAGELAEQFAGKKWKGEIVLVVEGKN